MAADPWNKISVPKLGGCLSSNSILDSDSAISKAIDTATGQKSLAGSRESTCRPSRRKNNRIDVQQYSFAISIVPPLDGATYRYATVRYATSCSRQP